MPGAFVFCWGMRTRSIHLFTVSSSIHAFWASIMTTIRVRAKFWLAICLFVAPLKISMGLFTCGNCDSEHYSLRVSSCPFIKCLCWMVGELDWSLINVDNITLTLLVSPDSLLILCVAEKWVRLILLVNHRIAFFLALVVFSRKTGSKWHTSCCTM